METEAIQLQQHLDGEEADEEQVRDLCRDAQRHHRSSGSRPDCAMTNPNHESHYDIQPWA